MINSLMHAEILVRRLVDSLVLDYCAKADRIFLYIPVSSQAISVETIDVVTKIPVSSEIVSDAVVAVTGRINVSDRSSAVFKIPTSDEKFSTVLSWAEKVVASKYPPQRVRVVSVKRIFIGELP